MMRWQAERTATRGDTFTDPLSVDKEGYLSGAVHYVPIMPVDNVDRSKTWNRLVTRQKKSANLTDFRARNGARLARRTEAAG
jgi:hypothetical protein